MFVRNGQALGSGAPEGGAPVTVLVTNAPPQRRRGRPRKSAPLTTTVLDTTVSEPEPAPAPVELEPEPEPESVVEVVEHRHEKVDDAE